MKRRDFLKGMVGVTAAAVLPVKLLAEVKPESYKLTGLGAQQNEEEVEISKVTKISATTLQVNDTLVEGDLLTIGGDPTIYVVGEVYPSGYSLSELNR